MKYQLVIQYPLGNASADIFDKLLMIEQELGMVLKGSHIVNGHDIGLAEMNIFIHTNDPDEAFNLAKTILSDNDLEMIVAAYRDRQDENYSVIWPVNYTDDFTAG